MFLFFPILFIEACVPRQFGRNDSSNRSSRLGRGEIGDRTGRCVLTLPCIHFLHSVTSNPQEVKTVSKIQNRKK